MQKVRRVRFDDLDTAITAERLTSEIRNCYETVDKGRKLLGRLYEKLEQPSFEGRTLDGYQRDYQLFIELDNLRDVLLQIAEKRKQYIEQLAKAEDIVWHDRREIEDFLRIYESTEKRLQREVDFFSRFSQKPQKLVLELQENSRILGDLLSDLKEQLIAEEAFLRNRNYNAVISGSFSASARDRWSYIQGRRGSHNDDKGQKVDRENGNGVMQPERNAYVRRSGFGDIPRHDIPSKDHGNEATSTSLGYSLSPEKRGFSTLRQPRNDTRDGDWGSVDEYDTSSLSNRLKQLVKQSENVQKMICSYNPKEKDGDDYSRSIGSESRPNFPETALIEDETRNNARFGDNEPKKPSGRTVNSLGVGLSIGEQRSDEDSMGNMDMTWVLERCDEIERKMQECSPIEVRERLLYNLNQLEEAERDQKKSRASTYSFGVKDKSNYVNHYKIREDLLQCLDKMFIMEKSYGSAGEEIKNLKKDLKEALKSKDDVEFMLRNEIARLKTKLDLKSKDVEFYNSRLSETKRSLFELKTKQERDVKEAETTNQDANTEELKALKEECEKLKEKVEVKSKEVDELRNELQYAIDELHNVKAGPATMPKSAATQDAQARILSLEAEVTRLQSTNEESIAEELAALLKVIEAAETKQKKVDSEFMSLSQEYDLLKNENSKLVRENEELHEKLHKSKDDNVEKLQERLEELQLMLLAKNAEIEYLARNAVTVTDVSSKEDYGVDLQIKTEECNELRKRLAEYEELITNNGGDMTQRLENMYQECVNTVEQVREEKRNLKEDFKKQKQLYEDLLAECHNEMNELKKRQMNPNEAKQVFDKKEVLEALLNSKRSPEQLAEILSKESSGLSLFRENDSLKSENEKLQRKIFNFDKEAFAFQKEIESLKRRNQDLKEKIGFMKSENYLLNKIREDDGNTRIKSYKELLLKKEDECSRLRRSLDESVGYEERDELLGRLREIHRELLRNDDIKEDLGFEELVESLEKRDRENRRLKRQNRLLSETLGLSSPTKSAFLEKFITETENPQLISKLEEELNDVMEENKDLKLQVKDLQQKRAESEETESQLISCRKKVGDCERRIENLADENIGLRDKLRQSQNEVKELNTLNGSRNAGQGEDDLMKENATLREKVLMKQMEIEHLDSELDRLKTNLSKKEMEASKLKGLLESNSKANRSTEILKEQAIEKDEAIKELKKALATVEKERKETNEAYLNLKIKSEEEKKHFKKEIDSIQSELDSVMSKKQDPIAETANNEAFGMTDVDGGIKRHDRNKLIRKLQVENHQMAAHILSLEDETTAITKIVADMERGHGHLTGILRGHLVLQKDSTAKLLENSLHQYTDEFDSCRKKFMAVEDRYDKERKHLTRRSFAWDLFANATATVENISAIIHEGLIKVEDDLERDFSSDEDFESRDYKSRLWILRRRLDDVEKRYRDLMLRAEELSVRLDAKTAEYDVTQDELEDATRVLELNEVTMARTREELHDALKENARLKNFMSQLKESQERNAVMESELLKKEADQVSDAQAAVKRLELEVRTLRDKLKIDDTEIKDLRRRLRDQEKQEVERFDRMKERIRQDGERSDNEMNKLQKGLDNAKKRSQEANERILQLEDLLKKAEEKNASLEKYLQKARADCRSDGIDHHGTIHMLRDDLKKLFKENESLKKELSEKQKAIASLAKDLRKAKVAVKEQIGTERSLDEKVLDRAAKDQMMALKRRIKVLEMEKERLMKGSSIRERDQSFDEKRKRASPTKGSSGRLREESSASPSLGDDNLKSKESNTAESLSEGVFGEVETTEGDLSLASMESFKDFSEDVKQDIELRDNLIQELEARVKELKLELAMKSGKADGSSVNGQGTGVSLLVDEKTIQQQDFVALKKENSRLKDEIQKQKNAPDSYLIVQKDDMIKGQRTKLNELEKEITQKDKQLKFLQKEVADLQKQTEKGWKSKEIVLLESNNPEDSEWKSQFENLESLKAEIGILKETCDKQKQVIENLEAELKVRPEQPKEDSRKFQEEPELKQHVESVVEASFEFPTEQAEDKKTSRRGPQFINIGEAKQSKAKDKTLSRIPVSPRPKQAKVSQGKDAKSNDQHVSDTTKEQLQKKIQEQDEDIKTLLQSVELFETEVESLQKQVLGQDMLNEKLKKSEAEVKSFKSKNGKLQDQVKESKAHDVKLRDLEERVKKLSSENKEMEQQLKKDRNKQIEEGERKRSQLDAATKKVTALQGKINDMKKLLELKTAQFNIVMDELQVTEQGDVKVLRKAIKESIKRKISASEAKASSDLYKDLESRMQRLQDENQNLISELKIKNHEAEKRLTEIEGLQNNLEEAILEKDNAKEKLDEVQDHLQNLELESEDLRTRNIALEITQDAVSMINDKVESNTELGSKKMSLDNLVVQLKEIWGVLKGLLQDFGVVKEEDVADSLSGRIGNSNDLEQVVAEMEKVNHLLIQQSVDLSTDLKKQAAANSELEKKVEEFRKIIEETNSKITDLEDEVSEKEKGDEIGHKLLLDQIANLKKQVETCQRDKTELEIENDKRQKIDERLTEQIKFLEKQVSKKDSENSEITQRALDSEEDLEQMKNRVEELEDDYNRLLQFGMRLEDATEEDSNRERIEEDQKQLESLKERIQQLEEDKLALQEKVEAFTRNTSTGDLKEQDEDKDKVMLEETVYRLELDKADMQKRLDEYNEAVENSERLEEQLKDSERKVQNLEDAMFRLEIEKANLQKSHEPSDNLNGGENQALVEKIEELEDANLRMEEAILRLDSEREGLKKRINELTSDEAKGDINDLTLLLIDNEEKIADLQQEKRDLVAKQEELQRAIDDMLASPRSCSDNEGEVTDEEHGIFNGGPKAWKRRLVAAYRDLKEKSVEIVMLKMIVESKNVEIDLLSKELSEESCSISESFGDDFSSRSGRFEVQQQLRGTVRMLQEEVKLKSSEINNLREEISALQNTLQLQEASVGDKVAVRINGKDGNEVENENLQLEVKKLKEALASKEEQYNSLCDQLFNGDPIVTSSQNEDLTTELEETKSILAEKEKRYDELEENYELVYNELTKMKAGMGDSDVQDSQLGIHEKKIGELEKALSDYEEKCRLISNDFDELEDKYREEMNYASTHIGQLMVQIGDLEDQLEVMRRKKEEASSNEDNDVFAVKVLENQLKDSEDDLRRKNELISNLKETLANFYDNAEDQSGKDVFLRNFLLSKIIFF